MQFEMLTAHDYLELAFVDYFGMWTPASQAFVPALRQTAPHRRDAMFAHCNLLPRLLNGHLAGLQAAPLEGIGVLWCV